MANRLFIGLIAVGLSLPLCAMAQDQLERATQELADNYRICQSRLAEANQQIESLAALVKSFKVFDENTQALEEDIAEFQAHYNLIIEKYARMLELSGQIEERHVQNASMCQTSVSELQKALVDVNEKYNDAVRALNKPWYLRPMFFLGVLLGLAIGIPV